MTMSQPPTPARPSPILGRAGNESSSGELNLLDLALVLWRRKVLIVSIVVTLTSLSYAYIESITPRYRAETSLLLDTRRANVGIDPVVAAIRPDDTVIRSEVDVLRSRWLARRVVHELELVDDTEFNPTLKDPEAGLPQRLGRFLDETGTKWLELLPAALRDRIVPPSDAEASEASEATGEKTDGGLMTAVIEAVLARLAVLNDGRSYTVDLSFESEDPEKAARIANAFANLYLGGQVESKYEAAERGAGWLENKIKELRERVRASDTAVLEYRRSNALLGRGNDSLLARRLDQFGEELVLAERRRVKAETQLQEVREIAAAPLSATSAPALTRWPQLDDLLQKIRASETTITGLQSTYGPRHPRLVEASAERDRLARYFQSEVERILGSLESEARVAGAQEAAFVKLLDQLEGQNVEVHRDEVELRQLESEAAAARSLYDTFVASLDRTSVQLDLVQPDARVLSPAEPPLGPSYPQKRILLALTVIAALGLSLILTLVLEFLHKGFRSSAQVESAFGVPVIGMVPTVPTRRRELAHPSAQALQRPFSAFSESIRLVRSAIDLGTHGARRVVLVTSAVPDEGKTALALAMGRLGAQAAEKLLLIDCDLRAPTVAKELGGHTSPGLAELLLGECSLYEAIRTDEPSGLAYIPAGRASVRAVELLRSARMRELIEALRKVSETIVLDSPPVAVFSDALALSRVADTTLLVVRWDRTPRSLVSAAMNKLQRASANQVGVVLSRVDLARHATYGTGDFPHRYLKGFLTE